MEELIKDTQYEFGSLKEVQKKTETTVEANHSGLKGELNGLRSRVDTIEAQISANKKQITMLDEKIKALGRAAAAGGNSSMAGDLIGDLEKAIAQLRLDVDKNKEQLAREHERVN